MKKYKLNNIIKDWLNSDFEPFEKRSKTFIKLPDNPNVKYLGFFNEYSNTDGWKRFTI